MSTPRKAGSSARPVAKIHPSHGRGLAVVGALLTFATFVFHDALHEHYKDEVEEITAARTATEANRLGIQVNGKLAQLDSNMRWYGQTNYGNSRDERVFASRVLVADFTNYLTSLQQETANLRALAFTAGEGEAAMHFDEQANNINKPAVDAVHALPQLEGVATDRKLSPTEHAALQQASEALTHFREQLDQLGDKVYMDASVATAQRKGRLRVATYVSYMIYVVGWVVTFIGGTLSGRTPEPV